jgi:hypothetical protein
MRKKGYKGIDLSALNNAIAMSGNFVIEHTSSKVNQPRCTCGKVSYVSESDAKKFLKRLKIKGLEKKQYVYKCLESHNFHISTK